MAASPGVWCIETFCLSLKIEGDEKQTLEKAWVEYRAANPNDAEQTPSAVLRLMLAQITTQYDKAREEKRCILGQCNCGAAFQLSAADRQRGVRIVYSCTPDTALQTTTFNSADHEYAQDFNIEAVYVDIAYLKQEMRGDSCTITAHVSDAPPVCGTVTLVDMLVVTHINEQTPSGPSRQYHVGDGVGFMTAPPSLIPRAWKYAETQAQGLDLWAGRGSAGAGGAGAGAGVETGDMWPYHTGRGPVSASNHNIVQYIGKVGESGGVSVEGVDLLADEAAMDTAHEMCIKRAGGGYCTFSFAKTREDVRGLLDEIKTENCKVSVHGALYHCSSDQDDRRECFYSCEVADGFLQALESLYLDNDLNDAQKKQARAYYASAKHLRGLIPENKPVGSSIENFDTVYTKVAAFSESFDKAAWEKILSIDAWWWENCHTSMDMVMGLFSKMFAVAGTSTESTPLISDASTAYERQRVYYMDNEIEYKSEGNDLGTRELTEIRHLFLFQQIMKTYITIFPRDVEFEFTKEKMQKVCVAYIYARIVVGSKININQTSTWDEVGERLYANDVTEFEKYSVEYQDKSKALTDIEALYDVHANHVALYNPEGTCGEYWITLHDIVTDTGVTEEDATVAVLCWAEWFRVYVNRGGKAKQKCAGVLVRLGASAPLDNEGNLGQTSDAPLAAALMGYVPCARPMLRHCGRVSSTDSWYVKKNWKSADSDTETGRNTDTAAIMSMKEVYKNKISDENPRPGQTTLKGHLAETPIDQIDGGGGYETDKADSIMDDGDIPELAVGEFATAQESADRLRASQVSIRSSAACNAQQLLCV
jgi:hypothetical protein